MRRSLLLLFILACSPAYAELIKVVAVGSQISYDDPMGLLPFPQPPAGSEMTLTIILDSETPDSNAGPYAGLYVGAILSMTLAVGSNMVSALPNNLVQIENGSSRDGSGDGDPESQIDYWGATTFLDQPSLYTAMSLVVVDWAGNVVDSDALGGPRYPSFTGFGNIVYWVRDGPDQELSETLALSHALVDGITVTTIPLPASSLLLIPCLLAIAPCLRRRH